MFLSTVFFDKPKKGDQIFFTDGSSIYHTGLVYDVDNLRVYTVEGNTKPVNEVVGNGVQVCKKSYPLGASYIAGYGRPKYDETIEKVEENPTKSGTFTHFLLLTKIRPFKFLHDNKTRGKQYPCLVKFSS